MTLLSLPKKFKKDFPIFDHHPELVYLDSASSAQTPRQVPAAMDQFYTEYYSNIHRGVYDLSAKASIKYEVAREKVAKFINAPSSEQVIFTSGATESVNLVRYTFGEQIPKGSTIVLTIMEHHANFVPWLDLAEKRGLNLKFVELNDEGYITADQVIAELDENVSLVAVTQLSNVMGVRIDVKRIIEASKKVGAKVIVDATQSVVHMEVDVAEMDPDFLVFSGHKLYGPTGVGVLYVKDEILQGLPPFIRGGDMVLSVSKEGVLYQDPPHRFEAGTPNIAGVIGMGEAIDYMNSVGMAAIEFEDMNKCQYVQKKFNEMDFVEVYGPQIEGLRVSCVPFNVVGVHGHDTAQILADEGICVRAGHHCAEPLHKALGIDSSARVSFGIYNDYDDIDKLCEALYKVKKTFD